jgi:hypothetical protein
MKPPARRALFVSILAFAVTLAAGTAGAYHYVNYVPPFHPPPLPVPDPNGYEVALRAAERLSPPPTNWSLLPARERQSRLDAMMPVFTEVRRTLEMEWQVPWDLPDEEWDRQARVWTGLSHSYLLAGSEFLARGEVEASTALWLDSMALAAKLSHGGPLAARSCALMCHQMSNSRSGWLHGRLAYRNLSESLDKVRRIRQDWRPLSDTLETQRLVVLTLVTRDLRTVRPTILYSWGQLMTPDLYPGIVGRVKNALRPKRATVEQVDRYFQCLIDESKRSRADMSEQDREAGLDGIPHPLSEETMRALLTTHFYYRARHDKSLTDLGLLEVALAVRAHRKERGRYPRALNEIDRKWLPEVPTDLWRRPIAYRLKGGRPVVYSFGPDGKDDGGTPAAGGAIGQPGQDIVLGG